MALVCLCHRVSDRKVVRAVAHGADTVDAVGAVCGAGTSCGTCRPAIAELVAERQLAVTVRLAAT